MHSATTSKVGLIHFSAPSLLADHGDSLPFPPRPLQPGTGAAACAECLPGRYVDPTATACRHCPAGTSLNPLFLSAATRTKPPINSVPTELRCLQCSAGRFAAAPTDKCGKCARGAFLGPAPLPFSAPYTPTASAAVAGDTRICWLRSRRSTS
jgi:hypothetical protein